MNIKTCFIIIIFSLSQQSFYIQVLQENACLCLPRHIFQNTHLLEQYLNIDRHLHKTKPWIYFPFSYVMFLLFYHWIKLGTSHKDICIKWLSIRICLKKKRSEGKTKISGNQRSKRESVLMPALSSTANLGSKLPSSTYELCDLRKVTLHLWGSIYSSKKKSALPNLQSFEDSMEKNM